MRGLITFGLRFLTLKYQNMVPEIAVLALVVWMLVLACTFFSICSQPISRRAKWSWVAFVVMVPLLGGAVYCVYCLTRQDYGFLKVFMGGKSMKLKKRATGGATS